MTTVGHRVFPLQHGLGPDAGDRRAAAGRPDDGHRDDGLDPDLDAADARAAARSVRAHVVDPATTPLAKRRSRGTLIALMLLLVFLAIATWWVYRSAETIVQLKQGTSPAPATPTTPAPSTIPP